MQMVNLLNLVYAIQNQKSRRSDGAAFFPFLTLSHCKEKRDDLPVIAQNYLLGNLQDHLSWKTYHFFR